MFDGIIYGPSYKSKTLLNEANQPLENYLFDIISKNEHKSTVFMIDSETKEELTYGELVNKSYLLAARLQALGCKPQSGVGIVSENCLEYTVVILAAWLVGATVSCYDPSYTDEVLKHTICIARPSVIFCSSGHNRLLNEINSCIQCIEHFVLFDITAGDPASVISFSSLVQPSEPSQRRYEKITNHPDDTAVIFFTSGTTNLPKGVMHSHKNLLLAVKIHKEEGINDYEGNITIDTTAKFHISGFLHNLISIAKTETRVIMKKFNPEQMLSLIDEYKVEFIHLAPPLIDFIQRTLPSNKYDLSSLKYIAYGGAPLRSATEEALRQKLPLKKLTQIFGMSEALTCLVQKGNSKKRGCCAPIPGVQVKVIDTETGKTLGPHEKGELCIKNPSVMKGYCGNEKLTAEIIDEEGWLHTGDIAYYDNDGDFFIDGRLKDIIRYGNGFLMPPGEMENALMKHEDVQDAVVIGMPDGQMGELPKAYVVKKPRAQFTEDQLMQYVRETVPWYKGMLAGVTFVDEMPRNSSGKILRTKLKQYYQ